MSNNLVSEVQLIFYFFIKRGGFGFDASSDEYCIIDYW